ncbi:MAG: hypothetical protein CSA32_05720 [Desulfobulbus propionicus]|nr:MAG: hypothetical protein CSA32_05720 [Desulfobulbus propionicus]
MQGKGCFPEDMQGPLQYGPGLKGYVVNLLVARMVSLKRVQQKVRTLVGKALSEAGILISDCFRTIKFTGACCRITSYLQTMAHKRVQSTGCHPNGLYWADLP